MEIRVIKKRVHQGDVGIKRCMLYEESHTVCALVIETDVRYGIIQGYGNDENNIPSIIISKLDESESFTEVFLPEFKGWNFFCASYSKYDIHSCIVKQ